MWYRKSSYLCSKVNVTLLVKVNKKELHFYDICEPSTYYLYHHQHRLGRKYGIQFGGGGRVSFQRSNPVCPARAHVGGYRMLCTWHNHIPYRSIKWVYYYDDDSINVYIGTPSVYPIEKVSGARPRGFQNFDSWSSLYFEHQIK